MKTLTHVIITLSIAMLLGYMVGVQA